MGANPIMSAYRSAEHRILASRYAEAFGIVTGSRMQAALRVLRDGRSRSYYGAYAGANATRLEGDWIATLQAADEEAKRDNLRLRARTRKLVRDNPLANQYHRLVDLNVTGADGPKLQALVRNNNDELAKNMNDRLEESFGFWSERVTLDGRHGLVGLAHQVIPNARCEGEQLVRFWTGPDVDNDWGVVLEPIDPDQLDHSYNREASDRQNAIVMGIEIDAKNRPVAYHCFDEPYSGARARTRQRIPAREMLHLYDPKRVNQSRGVTDFHAVMVAMHFAGSYAHYELVAAKISAAKPIIWKRIQNDLLNTTQQQQNTEQPNPRPIDELEPGMFGFAPEGYEPANVEIDHPSQAFEAFMRDQKRDIATGLGVGYAALTADLSNTSFSSARTGTLLERDTWRRQQSWAVTGFWQPIYRRWLQEAQLVGIATGGRKGIILDARDPRRLQAAKFTCRGWDYVNPLQDANALVALIAHGLWSRTRAAAELGIDVEDLFDELAHEVEMAKEKGITISDAQAASAAKEALAQIEADAKANADTGTGDGTGDAANRALTNGHGKVTSRLAAAITELEEAAA